MTEGGSLICAPTNLTTPLPPSLPVTPQIPEPWPLALCGQHARPVVCSGL